jgi:aminoglycoside 2''-phosphotransferase
MDQATKLRIAKQLAGFLTALHTFSYEPITKVNTSQFQDEWRRNWSGYYRAVESTVFPHIGRREKIWIMNLFYDYLYPIEHFKFQPCLIHGDFKNDHILFDPKEQKLTGIIDFGQMRMGDPSYDYHDLCITYGGKFAALVLNHYKGPNDKTFLRRCSGFYEHLLSLSSMINALQTGNKDKFNLRHEWLKQKAKQAE